VDGGQHFCPVEDACAAPVEPEQCQEAGLDALERREYVEPAHHDGAAGQAVL
jgi:hypothetical protein